ncbi:MAG: T9SS type A sorting domain-containing protein [Saprospirales bacterium]|nr:T9SS type A sorting domain-containing protein [Saprospirales bacterium]
MLRNFLLLPAVVLLCIGSLSAQQRTCASHDVLLRQLEENPELQQIRDAIEERTNVFIKEGGASNRVLVTIPVVVHVVWNTTAENISDARILAQIEVLNQDFRRTNADASSTPAAFQGVAADCEVQFCMAQRDPNGNATNGIVRVQTATTSFSTNDNVKFTSSGGSNAWPRDQYLNLWVCDLGSGLLGYAQFPGGSASTDGVVCDYAYFGTTATGATPPFDKGRTATHEVGHWLNCYHIWGDDGTSCSGTDQVADTPNQADENYGCPAFPTVSCTNGPNGDMFMNYMDYTDDACMNLFTAGQKSRMQSLFNTGGFRAPLLSSLGCTPPSGGGCGTPASLASSSVTQTGATLSWGSVSGATSYNLQWKTSAASSWNTVSNITTTSYNLTGLSASTTYNYQVQANCNGTTGSYSAAASFTTQSSGGGGCSDPYEANNSRSAAKSITPGTAITALIGSSTDNDYFKFNVTSAARNIKINLTTLPLDYDLRLYRNNTQVGISQNGGTTPEQIIYNNAGTSYTYYPRVYGYNGAYSTSQCYTLLVSVSSTAWRTDGSTDGDVTTIEIPVDLASEGFAMWPNPANNHLTVEVPLEADAEVQVTIFDATGKAAAQQHRALAKGDNQFAFDLSTLSNGVYLVQVRNGDTSNVRRLVVNK